MDTVTRLYKIFMPPAPKKTSSPLRFGILGAANIGPMALIIPAKSHPDVVVLAVAARDKTKAEAYAKKHGIQKTYGGSGSYQELLDDSEIDVVYNPLPNGLHYEWTMKALAKGKHVLLEKPSADTAEETRRMFDFADEKGLVLLEAFHYRFHPAIQRVKAILDGGELGAIKSLEASLAVPSLFFSAGDIRYNLALGGGAMMDMGCYTTNVVRYLSGSNPESVVRAEMKCLPPAEPNVDKETKATFGFPRDITASIHCCLGLPPHLGFIPQMPSVGVSVQCEGGSVALNNFAGPYLWHTIRVSKREASGRIVERKEKAYNFGDGKDADWWSTYRHQLEAFVDKVRGRTPRTWLSVEDSVSNMEWIEKVYEKGGLGVRPASSFQL